MSAEIIDFPEWARNSGSYQAVVIPRKRVFYLGIHSYSAGPGYSWTTKYWVKRVDRGRNWEVYCTSQETGSVRLMMGTFDPDEVREYFDSVYFELTDEDWADMGWTPCRTEGNAEILDLTHFQ